MLPKRAYRSLVWTFGYGACEIGDGAECRSVFSLSKWSLASFIKRNHAWRRCWAVQRLNRAPASDDSTARAAVRQSSAEAALT
jgi:hypothetical protein